jgi:RNA polymerase subunit RPABC4/transcription elongation factor Spt4
MLTCPECGSEEVALTWEQMFMAAAEIGKQLNKGEMK